MSSVVSRFFCGLWSPFRGGLFLLRNPSLLLLAAVPVVIVVVLLITGLITGWGYVTSFLAAVLPQVAANPDSIWFHLSFVLAYALFSILLFLLVLLVANSLAAPFNGLLAERILKLQKVIPERPYELLRSIRVILKMLAISVVRSLLFISIGVFLIGLGFIPIFQVFVWFIGSILVVFDCVDYPLEALETALKQRFALYKQRFPEFSGAAVGLGLTLFIPGLNFVMLPAMVAGCSLLIAEFEKERKQETPNEYGLTRRPLRPT